MSRVFHKILDRIGSVKMDISVDPIQSDPRFRQKDLDPIPIQEFWIANRIDDFGSRSSTTLHPISFFLFSFLLSLLHALCRVLFSECSAWFASCLKHSVFMFLPTSSSPYMSRSLASGGEVATELADACRSPNACFFWCPPPG